MANQPKAGRLLVFSAALVFVQATVWFGGAVSLAIVVSDARIPAAIAAVIAIGMVHAQYRSLFRRRPKTAMRLSMVLALCAFPWACLLLLAIVFAATGDRERTSPVFYLGVAFVSAMLAGQLLTAAAENERWGVLLAKAEASGGPAPKATFSLQDVFVMTTVVAVLMSIASWLVRNGVWEAIPRWLRG
jgi:hypothetical protein